MPFMLFVLFVPFVSFMLFVSFVSFVDQILRGGGTMRREPDRERIRRQNRKRKLRHLRARLAQTRDPVQRRRLIEKIRRISPAAPVPEA
jgi:hypothetical protein